MGSKQQEPIIARLDDDRLMLGRDESSILIDSDGNPTQRYPISWSDLPIQIGKLKITDCFHNQFVLLLHLNNIISKLSGQKVQIIMQQAGILLLW